MLRLLQGQILRLWLELKPSCPLGVARIECPRWTWPAILFRKDNRDVRHAGMVDALSPGRGYFRLRTLAVPLLPVYDKVVSRP